MQVEDRLSTFDRQQQKSEAQQSTLQAQLAEAQEELAETQAELAKAQAEREQPPEPKFSAGQSVHQFWAKWMAG